MEILVAGTELQIGEEKFRCSIGRGGYSKEKKEGDGATPVGKFNLREIFYRADRMAAPITGLPVKPIDQSDGWCDDPFDQNYNRMVRLPYAASHEELWRDDHLYDLIVVIGYNDDPVVKGKGSAIFMHVASANFTPTEGCIGLELAVLKSVVVRLTSGSVLVIADAAHNLAG